MTKIANIAGSEVKAILAERERKGLIFSIRTHMTVLILMAMMTGFTANGGLEISGTLFVVGLALLIVVILHILVSFKKAVHITGWILVLIDGFTITALPFIWYYSVGGDLIPAAYLLKTSGPIISTLLLVLSAMAVRPLYPLLTLGTIALSQLFILSEAMSDLRSVFGIDYVRAVMGPEVSWNLLAINWVVFVSIGLFLFLLLVRMRKTMIEGVNREKAAVLFADIRDFTTLSEKMRPDELLAFLSDYQGRMVRAIFSHGGTLDKFIGDGILASFGTPEERDDDAQRAVLAGLAMKKELASLNEERTAAGLSMIGQGIGIHWGEVVSGNVGSTERLEYTVIGDAVNTASRIESACKEYNGDFLVSEEVKEKISGPAAAEFAGEAILKGKKEAVRLYRVVANGAN